MPDAAARHFLAGLALAALSGCVAAQESTPEGPTTETVDGHVFSVGYDDVAFVPETIIASDGTEISPFPLVPTVGAVTVRPATELGETLGPNETPYAMARTAAEAHCARYGQRLGDGPPQLIVTDGWRFPTCTD